MDRKAYKSFRSMSYEDMLKEKTKKAQYINIYYPAFVKNKGKSLEDFIKSVNEAINEELSYNELKKITHVMKRELSPSKGEEMEHILGLSKSLSEEDHEGALIHTIKLRKINKMKEIINSKPPLVGRPSPDKEEKLEELSNTLKKIVNGEKIDEDVINDREFNQKIKNSAKDLDEDLYCDYFIKARDLKQISEKELDQLLEVINYFITNLQYKVDNFWPLHFEGETTPVVINNINVKPYTIDKLDKTAAYYRAKERSLTYILNAYTKYRDMLIKIKEEQDFTGYSALKEMDKKIIQSDYIFISDFYKNVKNISKTKEVYINKLNLKDSKIKEYQDKFNKKLIIEKHDN